MDDAGVPSLLSLPLLGYVPLNNSVYVATRAGVLSPNTNPYYYTGTAGAGVGGPHVGYGYIWPMSLVTQVHATNL
jgi:meiotically up-regulated gene 157 (Mug157) protein